MSRSASLGVVTEFIAQPQRTMLITTLIATCALGAVAHRSVNHTDVVLADNHSDSLVKSVSYSTSLSARHYADPSLKSVSYTASARASNYSNPLSTSVSDANPVLAGNYPDPSAVRVGQDYWATATSSGWAPQFPIMHSRDLVNWQVVGSVFQKSPTWSDGNYWAPEITRYRGRYFVYYAAHRTGGPRCVAVATALRPIGPYTDHGPLVCQALGSIDPMAVTDENGWRYLVWKEGGNSHDLPTPIWAQRLSSDGMRLMGERTILIRNDATWEAKVVEGPFILRHGGWFYMFYSGNDCCSVVCNYALGVARSPYLLGPWEKNPANPILKGNEVWKCPGHGSIVNDAKGRDYLLYHAYQKDSIYVGRQALLGQVNWGANQWPTIDAGVVSSKPTLTPVAIKERHAEYSFVDNFTSARLTPGWQWPQANEPSARIERARKGWLALSPTSAHAYNVIGAVVARSTTTGDYEATTLTDARAMKQGALAGLAAYGDGQNALGIAVGNGKIIVWKRQNNVQNIVAIADAPRSPLVLLRMTAIAGHRFHFAVSQTGKDWIEIGDKRGNYLPPWGHAVRVALTSGGALGAAAKFDWLRIVPSRPQGPVLLAGS